MGYDEADAAICGKECAEQMNRLWHKATVVMKMVQGGVRPFVKLVMHRLQQAGVSSLQSQGKPWDCSPGPERVDAGPDEVQVTDSKSPGHTMTANPLLCKSLPHRPSSSQLE